MRHVALLLAALCLLAPFTAAGASAPTGPNSSHAAQVSAPTPFEVARTTFTVSLHEDGDARWTVAVLYRFESEESRRAFETFANEYESSNSTVGPSADVFRNAVAVAEDTTGRSMAIREANQTADLVNETAGVLRLRFTWTNFLEPRPTGELVLDDVLRSGPEETWFPTLGPRQRLVIEPPPGYIPTDVSIVGANYQIVSRQVVVEEPSTFAAGDVSITYESTGAPRPFWQEVPFIVGSAGLLVLLGAAGYVISQRRDSGWSGSGDDGVAGAMVPPSNPSDGDGAVTGDGTGAGGAPGVAGAAANGDSEPEPDPQLLSDEERVERLLDRNGGRMRQADIVKETGWSDAKVSQLLSTMADDGEVEKLRLGRENLISLPDGDEREE